MILTCHLVIGALIASKVQSVPLVLSLAFLSHYFLDLLPQIEYKVDKIRAKQWSKSFSDFSKVFLDIAVGLLLILLFSKNTVLIFVAAFVAIVPDGFTLLYIIFDKNKLLNKHRKFHKAINLVGENEKIPLWGKFLCQALVVFIAVFFLLQ